MKHPFAVPGRLPPKLARVRAYWEGLLRGGAKMPFWDDARLTDLPDMADWLLLLDAFEKPERFRFGQVGRSVGGDDLAGRFLDETSLEWPLEFIRAQASATVECAGPTGFRRDKDGAARGYTRLLLPMWGEGRISMILAAVEPD